METLISNLQNGNLKTAKTQAKRFGLAKIISYLENDCGWNFNKAALAGMYLKGQIGWEEYCRKDFALS